MWPIHLNMGFKTAYFYEGFYFLVSILVAAAWIARRLDKAGLGSRVFLDSLVWIILGAIVGARVFHFAFWNLGSLLSTPLSFFRFWEGGLSITGGLAGGVLTAFLFFRRRCADFWHSFAIASPAVLAGQAIGRVGCFLNGDAWGMPTHLPWGVPMAKFGVFFPSLAPDDCVPSEVWTWSVRHGFTDPGSLITTPLHPTQLYEALGDLLLAAMLLLLIRRLTKAQGYWSQAFWLHLGGYSLLRCGLEFLHGDRDAVVWAGMTALQIGLLSFSVISVLQFTMGCTRWGASAEKSR